MLNAEISRDIPYPVGCPELGPQPAFFWRQYDARLAYYHGFYAAQPPDQADWEAEIKANLSTIHTCWKVLLGGKIPKRFRKIGLDCEGAFLFTLADALANFAVLRANN